MVNLSGTYGALVLGALFASSFSGIITSQCIVYFKLFPRDKNIFKALVSIVWVFDVSHTALVWTAMWQYTVAHFGDVQFIDHIPPNIALSVVLTASLTFLCHCFFAHRIHHLSNKNWYFTIPVLTLATCRLALASVSGGEMIRLRSYARFRDHFRWLFSLGLGTSSAADILITVFMLFLLQDRRSQSLSLDHVLDSLILYSFEMGTLTSLATVASMVCWVTLDSSLVFLGLHFVIGKLYANSLLASLNARLELRRSRSTSVGILNITSRRTAAPVEIFHTYNSEVEEPPLDIQIGITKQVQYDK